MKRNLAYYDIYPKLVPAGEPVLLTIAPLGEHTAFRDGTYTVVITATEEDQTEAELLWPTQTVQARDGKLQLTLTFRGEQEFYLSIFAPGEPAQPRTRLSVFSMERDLYERRPYRGDLHVHSSHSHDGLESPGYLAGSYRKAGYDFIAITDHGTMSGSLEGIRICRSLPTDFLVLPGEEVHPPENHIHTVHIGGHTSVNDTFRSDEEGYRSAVEQMRLHSDIPQGANAFEYASCLLTYKTIRDCGGMSILVHPYWQPDAYHMPRSMLERLFDLAAFDAFEVLGGHEAPFNNMQTAFYQQRRSQGQRIPIVGSNDSHGTEDIWRFNWYSTIVLARELSPDGIREAILSGMSAAVEHYPNERPRVYGEMRMVRLVLFLLKEYFPLHDELCVEEGIQLKRGAMGSREAKQVLQTLQGRTGRLLAHLYEGTELE